MPRRFFPFVADAYYHFYNRGNNRQPVFFDTANYLHFLMGIENYLVPKLTILAYCLMPTHYHILVRVKPGTSEVPPTSEVSRAMQKFLISYTKRINHRFERVGALFQGQFQGKPMQSLAHLLNLCVYIHANPVKDGLVGAPEDWEYSDYLEWTGRRQATAEQQAFVNEYFGSPAEYRALVREYAGLPMSRTSEV